MKRFFVVFFAALLMLSCAEEKHKNDQPEVVKKAKDTVKAAVIGESKLIDPDPDDGVPPERYSPHNSNIEVAEKIRKFLTENLLKDDLKLMTDTDRKFQYEEVDLNGDGKNEYLVGLESPYFCGTGGCTFYLLNNDGSVITIFSVSETPFIALFSKTNGWRDLLVRSNGAMRLLKFDGKTYPPNPSVAPKFTEIPSDDAYRLLWDEYPIPTFKF